MLPIDSYNEFLDSDISMYELECAMKQLKNDKSPGFDKIINEFLKNNTYLFKCTLLKLFNYFLTNSYFPKAWSIGLIIPIFKQTSAATLTILILRLTNAKCFCDHYDIL